MFERIGDLPLHPLAVHGPVVLIPLCVAVALAYLLVPRWRSVLTWGVVALALLAPLSAFVAVRSGQALRDLSGVQSDALSEHQGLGENTLYSSVVLGAALLVYVGGEWYRIHRKLPAWGVYLHWVVYGVAVIAAITAAVYVVRAGDTGASMVWGSVFGT